MSNILVTGSAGFIGRALVRRLRGAGYNVFELDQGQGDISLPGTLLGYPEKGINQVFHLAGQTFVPESWINPQKFYQVNVMGTINILELCRKSGAKLTYISSYLYGKPDYLPIDENHPVKSYNPYSHSKILAESSCRFYADNFNVPITILRPFNVYGPGQSKFFLISEIISKVLDPAIPVVEVMDLLPKRDYIYLDDLINALMMSMEGPKGIYNIGCGYSKSVEEIIQLVLKSSGIIKEYRSKAITRPNEIFDLFANITKAKEELGWSPEISFDEGIKRCIHACSFNH